jgi:hypothetical protein
VSQEKAKRPHASRRGRFSRLAASLRHWQPRIVDEPEGIYRGEVLAIMGALADIHARTSRILRLLEDEDEDDEEEEADA